MRRPNNRAFWLSMLAVVPIVLSALVALGYGLFLATGESAWNAWQAECRARGDRLAWGQLVPPRVPDADNFARAPLVAESLTPDGKAGARLAFLAGVKGHAGLGNLREGWPADLEALFRDRGREAVLTALEARGPELAELKEAIGRPACRLPWVFEAGGSSEAQGILAAQRVLVLRAMARLDAEDAGGALGDTLDALRMADHFAAQPSILAAFLRSTLVERALLSVTHGLERHLWPETHLRILQERLARLDILGPTRLAGEGERLVRLDIVGRDPWRDDTAPEAHPGAWKRGFICRNLLASDRAFRATILEPLDPEAHRWHPEAHARGLRLQLACKGRPDLGMAYTMDAPHVVLGIRAAWLQGTVDQAQVACALERFRIARGVYPGRLEELVPAFAPSLPVDVTTGGPLRYRREGTGYVLYGLGMDGRDEGGVPAWRTQEGKAVRDLEHGDWPWRCGRPAGDPGRAPGPAPAPSDKRSGS